MLVGHISTDALDKQGCNGERDEDGVAFGDRPDMGQVERGREA
jgi:hypothetical protein